MKIDPFQLTTEETDWEQLLKRPTVNSIREALAKRRLEHLLRLRNTDMEAVPKIQGRISELEDLLRLFDGENF